MIFAEYLKKELESLGLEDITLDEHGYLFATLPANIDKEVPTIGFIAHMDTSPDMQVKMSLRGLWKNMMARILCFVLKRM